MIYRETFDRGPGGWYHFLGNQGLKALEWRRGAVVTRSPWWVDYNHAPPGAGYLQLLFALNTKGPFSEHLIDLAGGNHFVAGGFPLDFRDARITVRISGELELEGAKLLLLVQARIGAIISGWLLTGHPIVVGGTSSEQSVRLNVNEAEWACLGGRHDRQDYYNVLPLERVLADVNCNIMFVLFPIDVRPMGPIGGDPHRLRPGRDYPIWTHRLPEGYVQLESVQIEFSSGQR